jgi:hypothetical protein
MIANAPWMICFFAPTASHSDVTFSSYKIDKEKKEGNRWSSIKL